MIVPHDRVKLRGSLSSWHETRMKGTWPTAKQGTAALAAADHPTDLLIPDRKIMHYANQAYSVRTMRHSPRADVPTMRSCKFISAILMLSAVPAAHAEASATRSFTFEGLESDYQWYGDMQHAKASLLQAVPIGTSFWGALEMLEKAGARCSGVAGDPRSARCSNAQRITINDYYPADAIWTVALHLEDGKADNITVTRDVDER